MGRDEMMVKLREMGTSEAGEAARLLVVADDIFSEIHAACHARWVLAGEHCPECGPVRAMKG
jgi:hypothetical protein